MTATTANPKKSMNSVIRVIVISLLIDLLAFTIPLPLFPRIIETYLDKELPNPIHFSQSSHHYDNDHDSHHHSVLSAIISTLSTIRSRIPSFSSSSTSSSPFTSSHALHSPKTDIVLLGGLLGSIFAICQFIVSPHIGSLADRYGRRQVLLFTMLGNIVSALIWVFSSNFELYLLSRLVAGLSEGNAQLAIAIISDVTTQEERPRQLALVGMCFALAFTVGPPLGAYLVKELPIWTSSSWVTSYTFLDTSSQFVLPALVTVILLSIETIYLYLCLPETREWKRGGEGQSQSQGQKQGEGARPKEHRDSPAKSVKKSDLSVAKGPVEQRLRRLRNLKFIFFIFSFVFSGTEFTLTFLTFDLLSYSNSQNGRLLGAIGLLSSLIQGGIVRRRLTKVGPSGMVKSGLYTCAASLFLLAYLPKSMTEGNNAKYSTTSALLVAVCLTMAWTSGTVVNSLNAMASNECDEETTIFPKEVKTQHEEIPRGKTLGNFRSAGQLGRALGPLTITAGYWLYGPSLTYAVLGGLMLATRAVSQSILQPAKGKAKMQ